MFFDCINLPFLQTSPSSKVWYHIGGGASSLSSGTKTVQRPWKWQTEMSLKKTQLHCCVRCVIETKDYNVWHIRDDSPAPPLQFIIITLFCGASHSAGMFSFTFPSRRLSLNRLQRLMVISPKSINIELNKKNHRYDAKPPILTSSLSSVLQKRSDTLQHQNSTFLKRKQKDCCVFWVAVYTTIVLTRQGKHNYWKLRLQAHDKNVFLHESYTYKQSKFIIWPIECL